MKNLRTPRTLADSEFLTGYPIATDHASSWDMVMALLAAVFLALIVFGIV